MTMTKCVSQQNPFYGRKKNKVAERPTFLGGAWRGATWDFTFMFWIITNDCACLIILSVPEYLINKFNYGVLQQLPATSGHIKSKQQTFTLTQLFLNQVNKRINHSQLCKVFPSDYFPWCANFELRHDDVIFNGFTPNFVFGIGPLF